jgi:hypothetical protein
MINSALSMNVARLGDASDESQGIHKTKQCYSLFVLSISTEIFWHIFTFDIDVLKYDFDAVCQQYLPFITDRILFLRLSDDDEKLQSMNGFFLVACLSVNSLLSSRIEVFPSLEIRQSSTCVPKPLWPAIISLPIPPRKDCNELTLDIRDEQKLSSQMQCTHQYMKMNLESLKISEITERTSPIFYICGILKKILLEVINRCIKWQNQNWI